MRTDLFSGQGALDVVYDVKTGELVAYNGDDSFHSRFGGKTYYTSCSGVSHAGWTPASPAAPRMGTYRVDTRRPWASKEATEPFFGHHAAVPIDYRGGRVSQEWPILVINRGKVSLIGHDELAGLVLGELRGEERPFTWSVFADPQATKATEVTATAYVSEGCPKRHLRAVMAELNEGRLSFRHGEVDQMPTPNHWVGLEVFGDQADSPVFKIRRGMAVARYSREDLVADLGVFQEALPEGFLAITTGIVVTPDGTLLHEGGEVIKIPADEVFRLVVGGSTEVVEFLCGHYGHYRHCPGYEAFLAPAAALYREGDQETAASLLRIAGWGIRESELREAGVPQGLWSRWDNRYGFDPNNNSLRSTTLLEPDRLSRSDVRAVIRLAGERRRKANEA